MAKSSKFPDPYLALNGPDPYSLLKEEKRKRAAKELLSDDEAVVQLQSDSLAPLLEAIQAIGKKMDQHANQKPPVVNVAAPEVTVEPPIVEFPEPPTEWDVKVVERDENNLIKRLRFKAIK